MSYRACVLYPFEGARVVQGGEQRRKSSLTCFLLRERKCLVSPPAVAVGLKGDGEARGILPFCNTDTSMVKPESGGSAS